MPVKKSSNQKKRVNREQARVMDVQISFLEGVIRRDPKYVEALQLLGDQYTKRGRYVEGLKVDEQLTQLEPGNPLTFYNLACSYTLTEQFESAARSLIRALELGYRDFKWLARDPDLKQLRAQPVYEKVREIMARVKADAR
jgi:tetratricopeptide (TPR) repeat protein